MRTSLQIRLTVVAFLIGIGMGMVHAATDTVMLLYTSDLHDHICAGGNGKGGMPYISGYVRKIRSERPDVILVDGGDVLNKGHILPYVTKGEVMYEAMKMVGYTAGAPGNHDFRYGLPQLLKCASIGQFPVLCVNAVRSDGLPLGLPASKIVDADGVKVGIIGFTLTGQKFAGGKVNTLNVSDTAKAIGREAERLDREAHLIVAVGHFWGNRCSRLAGDAPAVDVFVGAHNHRVIKAPLKAGRNAIVVQAGCNALHVGRLELTIDLQTEEILERKCLVAPLPHNATPLDEEMAAWIREAEAVSCPGAREVLGIAGASIDKRRMGRVYAHALRQKAGTDIALISSKRLLGETIIKGQRIDRNAVFATHMPDGHRAVTVQMSGAELKRCLAKAGSQRNAPFWDGFSARLEFAKPVDQRVADSDLLDNHLYSVAMHDDLPKSLLGRAGIEPQDRKRGKCDFTVIEALEDYLRQQTAEGKKINPL